MTTTDRFTKLDMREFSVHDGKGASRHYVEDMDLTHEVGKALGSGTRQGVVLLMLGIDDHPAHAVTLNHYQCLGTPVEVLALAIRQLEKVRLELSRIEDAGSPDRD
jgi:hypothetical protein